MNVWRHLLIYRLQMRLVGEDTIGKHLFPDYLINTYVRLIHGLERVYPYMPL